MDVPATQRQAREQIQRQLDDLPMLPSVVLELAGLDARSEEFAARVAHVAAREPSLAARILSVANSVESAPAEPILTLPEAIMRIGSRRVAALITSFAVMRVFVPTNDGQRNLWRHALQVAAGAAEIAAAAGRGTDPQEAYLVGLLHDIGRFVMFEHDPLDLGAVEELGWSTPRSLVAAEREVCGFDHCELGWMASEAWGLPEQLGELLRLHHTHGPTIEELGPRRAELLRVVQQADSLSCLLLRKPELPDLEQGERVALLQRLCIHPGWSRPPLDAKALSELVARIAARSAEEARALGLDPVAA